MTDNITQIARCTHCKKKLKPLTFDCKCNKTYCEKCYKPEQHNCTFNYKEEYKKELAINLNKLENKSYFIKL